MENLEGPIPMDVKEQKKLDAGNRLAFDTHVGILMRQDSGLSKAVAMGRAYAAGPSGLNSLIVPRQPLKP